MFPSSAGKPREFAIAVFRKVAIAMFTILNMKKGVCKLYFIRIRTKCSQDILRNVPTLGDSWNKSAE